MEMKKNKHHVWVKFTHNQFESTMNCVRYSVKYSEGSDKKRLAQLYGWLLESYNNATDVSKTRGQVNQERYFNKIANGCDICGKKPCITKTLQGNNGSWTDICKDCEEAFF